MVTLPHFRSQRRIHPYRSEMRGRDIRINPNVRRNAAWQHRHPDQSRRGRRAKEFRFLHFVAAEHGSDLFDSGIVTPVVGWTDKYPGVAKLPDAPVWKKMLEEAKPRLRLASEVLTQVQRQEGFQRAFEAIMFNKGDIKAEMKRWNQEVQEALGNL